MKINTWLITITALAILSSCTIVRISENSAYNNSSFIFGQNIKALLVSNNNVQVNEFTRTFNKRFKEKSDFIRQFDSLCFQKFSQEQIFGEINLGASSDFLATDALLLSAEQQKKVDSLFLHTKVDYIIKIDNQEVTSHIQGGTYMPMYNAGMNGGMGMGMTTQSESCVVKSHFQIYDVKKRTKVLDFISLGKAGVVFLAFDQALVNAMNNSVNNAATYLKTGKIKF